MALTVPEGAILGARASKLVDLVVRAGPGGTGVRPEYARLDDLRRLAEVLAVADVVIARAAVGGEGQPVAVLRALGHERRVLGLCLDTGEVDFFAGNSFQPDGGGSDSRARYACAGEEER